MPPAKTPQPRLFDDDAQGEVVAAATWPAAWHGLAQALQQRFGERLHLGTSSWHFPGWAGQVWQRPYAPALLSRHGLPAYARHPLLRSVSLDRAFYRLEPADSYAALAAQVPEDFRFVVKAPALLTDAMQRDAATGAPLAANPSFLDAVLARDACAAPLLQGLGDKLGVWVLQLSPLPAAWLDDEAALHERLRLLAAALAPGWPAAARVALELRDPALLSPALARLLKELGWLYCLGVHDRMPSAEEQLPVLRALWPGDLVCRWNLQRGQRYAQARDRWTPFDRMQAPDEATRATLARVARATLEAGHHVFITINNKAEGSAPASVLALAQALLDMP